MGGFVGFKIAAEDCVFGPDVVGALLTRWVMQIGALFQFGFKVAPLVVLRPVTLVVILMAGMAACSAIRKVLGCLATADPARGVTPKFSGWDFVVTGGSAPTARFRSPCCSMSISPLDAEIKCKEPGLSWRVSRTIWRASQDGQHRLIRR